MTDAPNRSNRNPTVQQAFFPPASCLLPPALPKQKQKKIVKICNDMVRLSTSVLETPI
ncbi:MAG: hypothetical protein F6K41_15550 [Symploca sp. SIO3E6]|nr:hypothetical protein [Caldora sp. SIO3E6]